MSLRRAVGSLLARSFSPRAIPRMAPERSLHSNSTPRRNLAGAAGVAGAAFAAAGGGTFAVQYFRKGTVDDESAAHKKEEDMKAIFEDWMKQNDKSYHDEEEKAMRFQLFKATVDRSPRPPEALSYFADWTDQEARRLYAYPDGIAHDEEFIRHAVDLAEKYKKGELKMFSPDVKQGKPAAKQGDMRATQVSG